MFCRESKMEEFGKQIELIDVKAKEGQRWANIHTVVTAKCALKLLFDMVRVWYLKSPFSVQLTSV